MFQLEEKLRQWCNHFSQTESMLQDDVEELECHVRDSVEALTARGLDAEEAFLVATHRLGDPGALGGEYRKANGHCVWARRAFWMIAGGLLFELFRSLFAMTVSLGQVVATLAGADGTETGIVSIGVGVACCGLISTCVIRWHLNNEQNSTALASAVLNRNGWMIGGGLVLALLAAKLIQTGSYVVVAHTASIDALGQAAVVQAWSNGLLVVLVPSVMLVGLLQLHRAIWHPATVVRTS